MPSLRDINQALKTKTVTDEMRNETRETFMSHQRECDRCRLMPSRSEDSICRDGKLDYEKARLLQVV